MEDTSIYLRRYHLPKKLYALQCVSISSSVKPNDPIWAYDGGISNWHLTCAFENISEVNVPRKNDELIPKREKNAQNVAEDRWV